MYISGITQRKSPKSTRAFGHREVSKHQAFIMHCFTKRLGNKRVLRSFFHGPFINTNKTEDAFSLKGCVFLIIKFIKNN